MSEAWDTPSKSRALSEGAKPVSRRSFLKLVARVEELERRLPDPAVSPGAHTQTKENT